MAIYGFGAMFGSENDVGQEFLRQAMACIGWSEQEAPPLFDILRNIKNGDLVFIKSFNPRIGLTIKAIGIVTDRSIQKYIVIGQSRKGVSVRWLWEGTDKVGKIEDKYMRTGTLFEEHSPALQTRVINHLIPSLIATKKR